MKRNNWHENKEKKVKISKSNFYNSSTNQKKKSAPKL